jgi:hypothetical protein
VKQFQANPPQGNAALESAAIRASDPVKWPEDTNGRSGSFQTGLDFAKDRVGGLEGTAIESHLVGSTRFDQRLVP